MIGLSPLLVLKARRAALGEFVEDCYDYLGVGVELGDPVTAKKYFRQMDARVSKEVNGVVYDYELPGLHGYGDSHTQFCAKAPQYGVRMQDVFPENVHHRKTRGLELASQVLASNKKLQVLISTYKNFWRRYLSQVGLEVETSDRSLRGRHKSISALEQIEFLEPGLSKRVLEATRLDDLDYERAAPPVMEASWEFLYGGDDSRLETFLDYLNMMRDECQHIEDLRCGLCGVTFTPRLETFIYLKVGGHFCAFCVEAAIDSEHELFYSSFSHDELSNLIEFGLTCQPNDPQTVLREISDQNPITEVMGQLIKANLYLYDQETALSMLATIAARPRQSLTESLGLNIEEWVFRKANFPTKGELGADGHYCQSAGELQICEYLTSRGIQHSMHPYYRDLVEEDKVLVWRYRGDLRIENTIIEFFGLHDVEYRRRSRAKVSMGRNIGLKIIEVRPKDLKNLDLVFHEFLNKGEDSPFLF